MTGLGDANPEKDNPDDDAVKQGAAIEAAIDRLISRPGDSPTKLVKEILPGDHAGQMLARVLGASWPQLADAHEVTLTQHSGDSNSEFVDLVNAKPLGKYKLLRRIGQGGMGTVYEAHDAFDPTQPTVALKTIHPGSVGNDVSMQRFIREMKTLAKIEHEHIVPILESGAEQGVPFFTMPLVEGEDFSKRIGLQQQRVPTYAEVQVRARIVAQICEAVGHIHDRGYLHRDIKPGNILLRASDGQALLSDFGIAKLLNEDSGLTQTERAVGTVNYASPEQLWHTMDVDVRGDVYSLGITLYAALTGTRPFGEGTTTEIALRVKRDSLPAIQSINPEVPDSLAIACHRAIEKHPDDRYQSAEDFARDLNLAINGRRPLMGPISKVGRVVRIARRSPVITSASVAGLVVAASCLWMFLTRPAHLSLRVIPRNAVVRLDGEHVLGKDGHVLWSGEPGPHTIEVESDGYESKTLVADLVRGRSGTVNQQIDLLSLRGQIELESVPTGADVVVKTTGGITLSTGRTPFRSGELPTGEVELFISSPLFKTVSIDATVPKQGRSITLNEVKLAPAFSREMGSPYIAQRLIEFRRPFDQPVVAKQATLSELAEKVSRTTGVGVSLETQLLEKYDYLENQKFDVEFRSLAEFSEALKLKDVMLLPNLDNAEAEWSWVRFESGDRRPLHAIFSLHEVRSQLSPQQVAQLITHRVTPKMWETLGGPFNVVPIEGYRAVSVAASFDTLVGVQELLQELADLARRDRAGGSNLRDVWSDDIGLDNLVTVVDDFPFTLSDEPVVCWGHSERVLAMCFLDGKRLVSGSEDWSLRLWDTSTGDEKVKFDASDRRVNCIAPIPGRPNQFVIGDGRGELALYEADRKTELMRQWRHRGDLTCLAFSVDQKYLFSGGRDGRLVRYTLPDLKHDWSGPIYDQITSIATISRYDRGYVIVNRPEHEEVWSFYQETMHSVGRADARDMVGLIVVIPEKMIEAPVIPRYNKTPAHIIVAGTRTSVYQDTKFSTRSISEPLLSSVQSVITMPSHELVVTAHRDGRVIFRDELTLDAQAVFRLPPERGPYRIAVSPDDKKIAVTHWDYEGDHYRPVIKVFDCRFVSRKR